jgi:hypothetical protein
VHWRSRRGAYRCGGCRCRASPRHIFRRRAASLRGCGAKISAAACAGKNGASRICLPRGKSGGGCLARGSSCAALFRRTHIYRIFGAGAERVFFFLAYSKTATVRATTLAWRAAPGASMTYIDEMTSLVSRFGGNASNAAASASAVALGGGGRRKDVENGGAMGGMDGDAAKIAWLHAAAHHHQHNKSIVVAGIRAPWRGVAAASIGREAGASGRQKGEK